MYYVGFLFKHCCFNALDVQSDCTHVRSFVTHLSVDDYDSYRTTTEQLQNNYRPTATTTEQRQQLQNNYRTTITTTIQFNFIFITLNNRVSQSKGNYRTTTTTSEQLENNYRATETVWFRRDVPVLMGFWGLGGSQDSGFGVPNEPCDRLHSIWPQTETVVGLADGTAKHPRASVILSDSVLFWIKIFWKTSIRNPLKKIK